MSGLARLRGGDPRLSSIASGGYQASESDDSFEETGSEVHLDAASPEQPLGTAEGGHANRTTRTEPTRESVCKQSASACASQTGTSCGLRRTSGRRSWRGRLESGGASLPPCHPERSEGSRRLAAEIPRLRFGMTHKGFGSECQAIADPGMAKAPRVVLSRASVAARCACSEATPRSVQRDHRTPCQSIGTADGGRSSTASNHRGHDTPESPERWLTAQASSAAPQRNDFSPCSSARSMHSIAVRATWPIAPASRSSRPRSNLASPRRAGEITSAARPYRRRASSLRPSACMAWPSTRAAPQGSPVGDPCGRIQRISA